MFSEKTLKFLLENRLANSREWFHEHKSEYTQFVLNPLTELASGLAAPISQIDDQIITEPRVDKTISRIYCDMRFSKEKMLFREQMWLSFRRDKIAFPGYPEFFFVFSPADFFYGCGYYSASARTMESMRALILANDPRFIKAQNTFESQSVFRMDGEMYKKSRYPEQSERQKNWLDRKSICFINKTEGISGLFSQELCARVGEAFLKMEPVYSFFIHAENKAKMK